jgi:hypothetical protein
MLRRLKPVLTVCALLCGFCAGIVGMAMISAFGLAAIAPEDTLQTIMLVLLLLLLLVWLTDGLPEREDCCLRARMHIGLGKRSITPPLPDMAREP